MTTLAAAGISVRLGARAVLDSVSLSVRSGETVGLIGPNGAGKTTALRALAGLVPVMAGEIQLDGQRLDRLSERHRARAIAYFAQGAICHWPLLVGRLVALGRLPHLTPWNAPTAADRRAIDDAMTAADVTDLADKPVSDLSQGERARVLLARALAVEAPVLLADEPVAALDPRHQLQIMQVLAARARSGAAVIVVLHDLTLAARFCDRLVLLAEGRVLAEGTPAETLTPGRLLKAYGIAAEIGRRGTSLFVVPWEVVP